MSIKILCIADTHGRHEMIPKEWMVPADILIHAGDISMMGKPLEVELFCKWFAGLEGYDNKIFIAGNHDLGFEKKSKSYKEVEAIIKSFDKQILYLEDEGSTFIKNHGKEDEQRINIWGSPWQPWFCDWAFNLERGEEIKAKWNLIPDDTNVLITHGPPHNIGDMTPRGEHVGCIDLLDTIAGRLHNLNAHICGHIHYSHGVVQKGANYVKLVNAAVCNESYQPTQKPILIEI